MLKTDRLYCFSPPAMLATFITELVLAVYVLVRYKMSTIVRLVVSILILLSVFQFAEYNVCGRSSGMAMLWSRIGYIAITLLPPLALHLVFAISKRRAAVLKTLAYSMSVLFVATFGFNKTAFVGHICAGNYAIFQLTHPVGGVFFAYYYAWLLIGIGLALFFSVSAKRPVREALILQVSGYLSFILPTGIVNAINPHTIVGIPSVMCGFAIIYAVVLAMGIAPIALEHQKK